MRVECCEGRDSEDGKQAPRHQWWRQELPPGLQPGEGGPCSGSQDRQELESEADIVM